MASVGDWAKDILDWCHAKLSWLGRLFQLGRDVLRPLADLRIMLVLLTLGGVLLLFVDAGEDVIRQLVDSTNATDFQPSWENALIFLRWLLFLLACIWTGLNAWYWGHLLYKTKPGTVDEQPGWFTWVRRVLGVLPLVFAVAAMPLSARHGLTDIKFPMAAFAACAVALLIFFITRNSLAVRLTRKRWKLTQAADQDTPDRGANTIVRGDLWFVYSTSIVSVVMLVVLSIPAFRTHFAWIVGSAALTFSAIGCIIPLTSVLIYAARPYQIPVVLVGIWAFVIFSFWNDNHAVRTVDSSAAVAAVKERPSVAAAYDIWKAKHTDLQDPVILVASAGGASRAAYWTGTVLRAFDDRTEGAFFDHVFAISSVSGGTLGAIGYVAWLSERSLDLEKGASGAHQRMDFVQNFFGGDYLAPSLGGLLYPDLLQRFLPVPLPFIDRARSLEEAFEMGWSSSMKHCRKPPCGASADRFSQEYISLWATSLLKNANGRWIPLVLANGTHVETGKRIVTAPVVVDSEVFEDTYDFYALAPPVAASTAVLNSARFTLVSPPGRMKKDRNANGSIIDGGYFENGGLETLYDVARFIERVDRGRKIIIIEILNDDTMMQADLLRHPPAAIPVAAGPQVHWYSGLLSEFTSIIGGLYETRSSRGTLGAKRLSAWKESGLTNAEFFSFDLQPYGHDCQTTLNFFKKHFVSEQELDTNCHTAMSWALSLGSRDAMDVSFNTTAPALDDFLAGRQYKAQRLQQQKHDLRAVIDGAAMGYNAMLNTVLQRLESKGIVTQGAPAPTAAAKGN